jgi:thymidylate synthase
MPPESELSPEGQQEAPEPPSEEGERPGLAFEMSAEVDSLTVVNPKGGAALCSLWTPPAYVVRRLRELCPELLAPNSNLAVVGGLYGGGLKLMLRNLHYNPQVDTVILCGKDFSGAGEHLKSFFRGEVVRTGEKRVFVFPGGEKRELEIVSLKSPKSVYHMDSLLLPEDFQRKPEIIDLSAARGPEGARKLRETVEARRPRPGPPPARPAKIPLPRPEMTTFPSEPAGFSVACETIAEAWEELLFRLARFGVTRVYRNGKERQELLNFKALVLNPEALSPEELAAPPYCLAKENIDGYIAELLRFDSHDGFAYTYGNRLRSHFGADMLEKASLDLSLGLDSRHCYLTLWDNTGDMEASSAPCLVSLFFRKVDWKVNLTACFRSHNASRAWPLNALGLAGLLRRVVGMANSAPSGTEPEPLEPGTLTIISHSLALDTNDLADVEKIISRRAEAPYRMVNDPAGYFKIWVDPAAGEIVAEHYARTSELLGEYRGKTPDEVCRKLCKNLCLTDIGHAMYMGTQLEKAWHCLLSGREYVQDKKKPDL